jgi:hypothetical protein
MVSGFTDFQVVNYLIFREKLPEFSPRPHAVLTGKLDTPTAYFCP